MRGTFMRFCKRFFILVSTLFLLAAQSAFAEAIDFFASNNSSILNLETAYHHLTGKEQQALEKEMIHVFQKHHLEQGQFEDILGTYQMSTDQKITADNTEHFKTSPYQHVCPEKIFKIAKELAIKLHQDSVLVFIPEANARVGQISVQFVSNLPTISQAIKLLQEKLPANYQQAFSLTLDDEYAGFGIAKVAKIEWLGSHFTAEEIQKA